MSARPERVPSFTMLVPGPWTDASELARRLAACGLDARLRTHALPFAAGEVEVELVRDDGLGAAFARGPRGPLPEALVRAIAASPGAAVIEVGLRLDADARRVAALGRALRDAGGIAVRMEGSSAAWSWAPWLELVDDGTPGALLTLAVTMARDPDAFFTCGMHHFDLPDAEIRMDDGHAAVTWLDAFVRYLLEEQPVLVSGHTFRPDTTVERRVLERWPDARHRRGDGRHNPFGLWRFLAPGVTGLAAREPVPTIMPSLVATLTALEREAKRPLLREEVERLAEASPSIALSQSHVAAMERSRGYADIEPRLAWEQWQIVRAS